MTTNGTGSLQSTTGGSTPGIINALSQPGGPLAPTPSWNGSLQSTTTGGTNSDTTTTKPGVTIKEGPANGKAPVPITKTTSGDVVTQVAPGIYATKGGQIIQTYGARQDPAVTQFLKDHPPLQPEIYAAQDSAGLQAVYAGQKTKDYFRDYSASDIFQNPGLVDPYQPYRSRQATPDEKSYAAAMAKNQPPTPTESTLHMIDQEGTGAFAGQPGNTDFKPGQKPNPLQLMAADLYAKSYTAGEQFRTAQTPGQEILPAIQQAAYGYGSLAVGTAGNLEYKGKEFLIGVGSGAVFEAVTIAAERAFGNIAKKITPVVGTGLTLTYIGAKTNQFIAGSPGVQASFPTDQTSSVANFEKGKATFEYTTDFTAGAVAEVGGFATGAKAVQVATSPADLQFQILNSNGDRVPTRVEYRPGNFRSEEPVVSVTRGQPIRSTEPTDVTGSVGNGMDSLGRSGEVGGRSARDRSLSPRQQARRAKPSYQPYHLTEQNIAPGEQIYTVTGKGLKPDLRKGDIVPTQVLKTISPEGTSFDVTQIKQRISGGKETITSTRDLNLQKRPPESSPSTPQDPFYRRSEKTANPMDSTQLTNRRIPNQKTGKTKSNIIVGEETTLGYVKTTYQLEFPKRQAPIMNRVLQRSSPPPSAASSAPGDRAPSSPDASGMKPQQKEVAYVAPPREIKTGGDMGGPARTTSQSRRFRYIQETPQTTPVTQDEFQAIREGRNNPGYGSSQHRTAMAMDRLRAARDALRSGRVPATQGPRDLQPQQPTISGKPASANDQHQVQVPRIGQDVRQSEFQVSAEEQALRFFVPLSANMKAKAITISSQAVGQDQGQAQNQVQIQNQVQVQIPVQKEKTIEEQKQRHRGGLAFASPNMNPITPPVPPPIIPEPVSPVNKPEPGRERNRQRETPNPVKFERNTGGPNLFDVQVRRQGKFTQINNQGLRLEDAFKLGTNRVQNTLAASFQIIDERTNEPVSATQAGQFLGPQFGSSKKNPDVFVQGRNFRLGTPGEKVEIRAAQNNLLLSTKKKGGRSPWA